MSELDRLRPLAACRSFRGNAFDVGNSLLSRESLESRYNFHL